MSTNTDPGITRAITVTNPPGNLNYYRAARAPLPLFGFGLAARSIISFTGGAYLDSFDSSDTNYSNPDGSYNPAKAKDTAVAMTDANAAGSINLDGGYIAGSAVTGPGSTVTLSNGASVGDFTWIAGNTGIEPGHVGDDASVTFNDVAPPVFGTNFTHMTSGTVNGTNYTYIAGTGNYMAAGFALSGVSCLLVNGDAVVYVTGNVFIAADAYIYIAPGASLILYVGGSGDFGGGGVVNGNLRANTFCIYGLPTCNSAVFHGTAPLCGVADAPDAQITLVGPAGAIGSFVATAINIIDSPLHYDENLARVGPTR